MPGPRTDLWQHDGVLVTDATIGDYRYLRVQPAHHGRAGVLSVDLVRSLRDTLTAWLGDDGQLAPADPCRVRVAVQAQQRALLDRDLSGSDAVTEAGWAQHALAEIARAAGAPR